MGARLRVVVDLVELARLVVVLERAGVFFLAPLLADESVDFLRDAGLRGGEVVVATVTTRVTRATTPPQVDVPLDRAMLGVYVSLVSRVGEPRLMLWGCGPPFSLLVWFGREW